MFLQCFYLLKHFRQLFLKFRQYTIECHLYKLMFHLRLRVLPLLVIVCLSAWLKASSLTANFVASSTVFV